MADPKRGVERHVEAFNLRDEGAAQWINYADVVAPFA